MASRRRVLLAGLVAFVASVAVVGVSADCQPCDSIYDRCLPACNGMSSCQTRCMQSHFDCRMQVPGCFKATLEAEAEAAAAAAVAVADPTPTPAECYTSCAATYSKCTQACKPGDGACYAQCTTTYQQECLPKCGMPVPPHSIETVTTPVGGDGESFAQCQASCKSLYDQCAMKQCNGVDQDCLNRCIAYEQAPCNQACWVTHPPTRVTAVQVAVKGAAMKPTTKMVGDSCQDSCKVTYSSCASACGPRCNYPGGCPDCDAKCEQTLGLCLDNCRPEGIEVKAEPQSVSAPVTGVRECVKECKAKGKDAANKCKHEKFAKRAACYSQVPNMVKGCESGCTRKPHGLSAAMVSMPRECIEACHAEESDKIAACGLSNDCIHAVESAVAACDAACLNPTTLGAPLIPASNDDDKDVCLGQCKSVYRACFQECAPADFDCRAECAQEEVDCDRTCPSSSSSSSVSSSAVVFNCAWARAEMKRCADVYNGQPTSEEADDEYSNCIRVPSATIQNDPKCSFPSVASKDAGARLNDPTKCALSCTQTTQACAALCKPSDIQCYNACQAAEQVCMQQCSPASCYNACLQTEQTCIAACKPGDAACPSQCAIDYQQTCLPKCVQSQKNTFAAAAAAVESDPEPPCAMCTLAYESCVNGPYSADACATQREACLTATGCDGPVKTTAADRR